MGIMGFRILKIIFLLNESAVSEICKITRITESPSHDSQPTQLLLTEVQNVVARKASPCDQNCDKKFSYLCSDILPGPDVRRNGWGNFPCRNILFSKVRYTEWLWENFTLRHLEFGSVSQWWSGDVSKLRPTMSTPSTSSSSSGRMTVSITARLRGASTIPPKITAIPAQGHMRLSPEMAC